MKNIIVAGIGTEVGKTIVSAILVKMMMADYWKPISCGPEDEKDAYCIKRLVAEPGLRCHPEAYHFSAPLAPHHAAALEDIEPQMLKVSPPKTENRVVIESVGGVLVPLNQTHLTIDLFANWKYPWVLVSRNYLGSINHSLLTIEALKHRGLNVLGLVFNGPENVHSETFISNYAELPVLGTVREEVEIDSYTIERYSQIWKAEPFWKEVIG